MTDDRVARSLRLPSELSKEVELVARIDEMSANELITHAIEDYLVARSSNKEFREKLAECSKAGRDLYERLALRNTTNRREQHGRK